MLRSTSLMALLVALASPGVAAAQAGPGCMTYEELSKAPAVLGVARVTKTDAKGQLHFSVDPRSDRRCLQPRCRSKAFVLKGDELITGSRTGPFVCAWFKAKGRQTSLGTIGFLPADALTPLSVPAAPPPQAWDGEWVRDRERGLTSLAIHPLADGQLKVDGTTYSAPSRRAMARGEFFANDVDAIVPVQGRFAGKLLPRPEARPLAFDGNDYECALGMTLMGDWLVVLDDQACSGSHTSFSGVYRRERDVDARPPAR